MKRVLLLVSFLFPLLLFAKERRLSGTVIKKTTGKPMEGFTFKGKVGIVVSASNGSFSLPVVEGESLALSYVGFTGQSVKVTEKLSNVSVELIPAQGAMDEVVVTGYTTEKKKDLTGAISVVNMNDV